MGDRKSSDKNDDQPEMGTKSPDVHKITEDWQNVCNPDTEHDMAKRLLIKTH